MHDKPIIIAALVAFLALATLPVWYTLGAPIWQKLVAAEEVPQPDRDYPTNARCVESKEWMVKNHMNLLKQWRHEVVRDLEEGKKPYISKDGTEYQKSLTYTCMECHSRKEMCDSEGNTSCVRCHNYARVEPDCWNCHIELKGN